MVSHSKIIYENVLPYFCKNVFFVQYILEPSKSNYKQTATKAFLTNDKWIYTYTV